jgi:anti-anti-sigma factor
VDHTGCTRDAYGDDVISSVRRQREAERLTSDRAGRRDGSDPTSIRPRNAGFAVASVDHVRRDQGYALVVVTGEIDIVSRRELAAALAGAAATGVPAVIVDLSAVTLLSAAGFHCLQEATAPLAARGGCLHVVCVSGGVPERLLRLFDADDKWPRHPTAAAAIASVVVRSPA